MRAGGSVRALGGACARKPGGWIPRCWEDRVSERAVARKSSVLGGLCAGNALY